MAKSKDSFVLAPGLRSATSHPVIAGPIRDPNTSTVAGGPVTKVKATKSKNARARANKKQALADARAASQVQPAVARSVQLLTEKGKGKGKGKVDLPAGARPTSGTGPNICQFFNASSCCSHSPCNYAHIYKEGNWGMGAGN